MSQIKYKIGVLIREGIKGVEHDFVHLSERELSLGDLPKDSAVMDKVKHLIPAGSHITPCGISFIYIKESASL